MDDYQELQERDQTEKIVGSDGPEGRGWKKREKESRKEMRKRERESHPLKT